LRVAELKRGKNGFVERSKVLLDIGQKITLSDRQNNFVGILKIMSNAAKNFDNLTTLSVLYNYFYFLSKIILSVKTYKNYFAWDKHTREVT